MYTETVAVGDGEAERFAVGDGLLVGAITPANVSSVGGDMTVVVVPVPRAPIWTQKPNTRRRTAEKLTSESGDGYRLQ